VAKQITHTLCGTTLRPDIGALVEHLAACPKTDRDLALICERLVQTVAEATPVSRDATETPAVSREMTPSGMAAMRATGATYREIADAAQVAPETVRRRIAKWKRSES